MIVATAGHVDHGKTALVRALTGVDTDRLPEEKRRGRSIDLGFAYRPLDTGEVLGFVDVPGHERFLRSMVAGVAAIDLALIVVAADDGVMPQTEEHVAVLDLLGVERAVVALSKADRAASARLSAVRGEIDALLAATSMAGAPAFPVAAPLGRGVGALLEALESTARRRTATVPRGGFRLSVDRVFALSGVGTVVTGNVHAGRVALGDRLAVLPGERVVRVREIRAQNRVAESACRGDRVALNLVGADRDRMSRGHWIVTPRLLGTTRRLDVRVRAGAGGARALRHGAPVHLHLGTARVGGRLALLEGADPAAGRELWGQLVLDAAVSAAYGDRFVLRDPSVRRTIGGGRVVDPEGASRGRARPERLLRLAALDRESPGQALSALLDSAADGVDPAWFARARNLTPEELEAALAGVEAVNLDGTPRGRRLAPKRWRALTAALLDAVARDHRRRRDRLGPTAAELRRQAPPGTSAALVDKGLAALTEEGALLRRGAVFHLPGHAVTLSSRDRALWRRVEAGLTEPAGSPPALHPLAASLALPPRDLERFLERMAGCGLVHGIARHRWLTPDQIRVFSTAAAAVAGEAGEEGFAVARFRDRAGLGRNLAIDLLEYFDRAGLTRRRGERRLMASGREP